MEIVSTVWDWTKICLSLYHDPAEAQHLFADAGVSAATLQPLSRSAHLLEPYGRQVLFRSPEYEVMLATWSVGAECAPHDHGFSNGLVWLVEGQFIENHYHFDGSLHLADSYPHREASSIVSVNHQDIHSMRAPRGGISLHLYSPPIHKMKVYDSVDRRVLTVSDDCGAWVPVDHNLIVDVKSWPNLLATNI